RNLGVAVGERTYVVDIDPETATVRLGEREELLVTEIRLGDVTLRDGVALPLSADVVIRYRGTPSRARIEMEATGARAHFESPVTAPSPGQFAVFYDGDRVLGGGLIMGRAS